MGMDAGELSGAGLGGMWDPDITVRETPRTGTGSAETAVLSRTFGTEQEALDAIASLPTTDTDFAVMPGPGGSGFVVRQIEGNFDPSDDYHGRLIRNSNTEAVAVVFRDSDGSNQVISESGAGAVVTDHRPSGDALADGARGLSRRGILGAIDEEAAGSRTRSGALSPPRLTMPE